VAIASVCYLFLGAFAWRILLMALAAHFILEFLELRSRSNSAAPFLLNHSLRIAISWIAAFCFPDAMKSGWWIASLPHDFSRWYFASPSCASGIILCVPAGGILISRLIRPFSEEIRPDDIAGLAQGGRYIGWLERILVLLLVLMNQPNGIGFLIAAKSILRFGEIKDATQRKVAEYIIIGTFLSFGWALLISALTQKAIQYWLG